MRLLEWVFMTALLGAILVAIWAFASFLFDTADRINPVTRHPGLTPLSGRWLRYLSVAGLAVLGLVFLANWVLYSLGLLGVVPWVFK